MNILLLYPQLLLFMVILFTVRADKRAEAERQERESRRQARRDEEMRELAIKLRRKSVSPILFKSINTHHDLPGHVTWVRLKCFLPLVNCRRYRSIPRILYKYYFYDCDIFYVDSSLFNTGICYRQREMRHQQNRRSSEDDSDRSHSRSSSR